ncbi:MAG TPA: glycosyltransferase [Bryobacteraceae bacterium]|jgi:hypothetical protein|nr:glycosyltransferase [Bryobacteraceae bacterium]
MANPARIRISYCTTCHGRLWQIALTLAGNLRRLGEDEELVLLDYGSRDGLGRFIESSPVFQKALESGRLVYARTEAKNYHCPKAKNLAHRIARGELLVNLDADNNNGGMRRVITRCLQDGEDVVLQMDEGTRGDPLRGTFGRICIPRYWFYRLGGYDEAFAPIGHQDQDLIWRAKATGLRHAHLSAGGSAPIRNTMAEKASHTGQRSWHAMWRANERTSRRNLKEGRLVANPAGWGAANVALNFDEARPLSPVSPQLVSIVLLHRHPSLTLLTTLIERYSAMPVVGEILLINQNRMFTVARSEKDNPKLRVMNAGEDAKPFARLAAAALATFPAVLLTSDDFFVPEESLTRLHKSWFANPSVLHAIEPPRRNSHEVDLDVGALTTVAVCLTALAYGSRLCTERALNAPPAGAEDLLVRFAAAGKNSEATMFHTVPFFEMAERYCDSGPGRPQRPDPLPRIARWCRRNIAKAAEPELTVEGGPASPVEIPYVPFFAPASKNPVLFAGPWVGEFGWELCWWNPMVRFLAQTFEHVIVAAPESSRYLYEFATEFIPLKTEGWRFAEGKLLTSVPRVCNGSRILNPATLWEELGLQECDALRTGETTLTPKKWRNLAPGASRRPVADVLCAFRPEKRIDDRLVPGKNYPMDQCEELVRILLREGLTVACYGGRDNYWFDGTIDLRGQSLERQCAALSAAKCAVGPSSAPLHLASLTGCPHVTWSMISDEVAMRYATLWNPFNTPACFIAAPEPTPLEIAEEVLRTIGETAAGLQAQAMSI